MELDKGSFGTAFLEKGMFLMEVKVPGTMPLWLSRIFSELKIFPVSYSKYGTFYQEYMVGKDLLEVVKGSGRRTAEGGKENCA